MSAASERVGVREAADEVRSEALPTALEQISETSCGQSDENRSVQEWLEQLPLMALFERGEEIVAANELARKFMGTSESMPVDRVFLGSYPAIGDEHRQRFECLFSPALGSATPVTGVVQPFEAAGDGVRLVLLMESMDSIDTVAVSDCEDTFLEDLFNSAPEAMAIVQRGRILRVNREFVRMFGYAAADCLGASLFDLVVPEGRHHETEMLLHMVEADGRAKVETVRRMRSGEEFDVSVAIAKVRLGGGRMGHSVTYRDIRQEKQLQAKLQHTALHDPLTGLANRVLFMDRLTLTMARLKRRPDRNFAVIFLDIDHFKKVNDTWGHAAGDTLLKAVTARLRTCLRPQDTIGRFGGDEFGLVLDEAGSREDLECLAERIQNELRQPVDVGGKEVCVSASMGVVLGSSTYNNVEELLRDADAAMYRAKAKGRGRHEFYWRDGDIKPIRAVLPAVRSAFEAA